jgi:hypothetical protein
MRRSVARCEAPRRLGKRLRPVVCICGVLGMQGFADPAVAVERTVRQAGGADFPGVQAAIAASAPGDIVSILDSAVYVEDISFGALQPGMLDSKANLTVRAADGERPTIRAANTADRFGMGAPDFGGVLILSRGVRLQGLDVENAGNAQGSSLGLSTALSIHADGVRVVDCRLSQAGGAAGPTGAAVVAVSDVGRLAGGGDTVADVVLSDCIIEYGPFLGLAVFPFSFEVNPGIVDSVLHVRAERCEVRACATAGIESDGLGSLTLVDVVSRENGGDGLQVSVAHAMLDGFQALGNGGAGISLELYDVGEGEAVELTGRDVTCIGNNNGGLDVSEGIARLTNLVLAANTDFNLRFDAYYDNPAFQTLEVSVDHGTFYYPPGHTENLPNIILENSLADPFAFSVRNSLLVGPVGLHNVDASPAEDIQFAYTMLWNGGAPVQNSGPFTQTQPIPGSDPGFADPTADDFRVDPTAPAATADETGGPLGGAGLAAALPETLLLTGIGVDTDTVFLTWQGDATLVYDVRAADAITPTPWPVVDTVTGANGPQLWIDHAPPETTRYYAIDAHLP